MSAFRRMLAAGLACFASLAAAQSPDQQAAERALGPHWKQIARAAGIIFVGSVVHVERLPASHDHPIPAIQTKFSVERAIAGTHLGQVLTLQEWAAIEPMERPLRQGQRALYLFYPPSRFGLTSPDAGSLGQVMIDRYGNVIASQFPMNWRTAVMRLPKPNSGRLTVQQLERAIRSARREKE